MNNLAAASSVDILIQGITREIVNPLIVVMFAAALVAFVWGVRGYISGADNPEVRAKGSQQIMWGIIGMGLMVMTFAIVKIILNTFGISKDDGTKTQVEKVIGTF